MINISIINETKERELSDLEESTVIATVSTADRVVYFQQGDEERYINYSSQIIQLQQYYINESNSFLDNCFL